MGDRYFNGKKDRWNICVYMLLCQTCFGDSIDERRYIKLHVASDLFDWYTKYEIDIS